MNTLTKTVLTSALLTAVIAGSSANAGRAELSDYSNSYLVTADQKVFLNNTSGGDAKEVISYSGNSVEINKVSFKAPVATQEINR